MDWHSIVESRKYNIISLTSHNAVNLSPILPYMPVQTEITKGTGVIIDIKHGLVLTASDVVYNGVTIDGKSNLDGSGNLHLKLLAIYHELGFAICQLTSNDYGSLIRLIPENDSLDIELLSDNSAHIGNKVIMIGYDYSDDGNDKVKAISGVFLS